MSAELSAPADQVPNCPKCAGAMWDNRESKRNPRAPDFKCRDKSCDGVIWPPRDAAAAPAPQAGADDAPRQWPAPAGTEDDPACPVCGGKMWDDRTSKRNPRAPDFKCRNKPRFQGGPGCPGIIWPPREGEQPRRPAPAGRPAAPAPAARATRAPVPPPPSSFGPPPGDGDFPSDYDDDDLPF